jgi:hypothetical protein
VTTPYKGKPLQTLSVCADIRKTIRAAGFKWRPYILRRFFSSAMSIAEYRKIVTNEWRVFWMGHAGSVEATYDTNKALPAPLREEMRESYTKAAEQFLQTIPTKSLISEEEVLSTFNEQHLLLSKVPAKEVERIKQEYDGDLSKLTTEQIDHIIQELAPEQAETGRQKVVKITQVRRYLDLKHQKWKHVRNLNKAEAIIERLR